MNLHSFIQPLETCFGWVWKTSLQTTVLIALVWLVQRVFKRVLAPRWRYALSLLVLLRLALPVVPAATFSIFNLAEHLPWHERVMQPISPMRPIGLISPITPPQTVTHPLPTSIHPHAPLPLPGLVWLAGCLAILGATARQHRKLTRQLRHQPPLTTPRILALLTECIARLGVKRAVTVVSSATGTRPRSSAACARAC